MTLRVVLHSSIPLLSKRASIWQQNAGDAGLQFVKDDPKLSLANAVLVVGPTFTAPDAQLEQRLLNSGATVVRDTWLSACVAAKARAPIGKHQVQPVCLQANKQPSPPLSAQQQVQQVQQTPEESLDHHQQQQPARLHGSIGGQAVQKHTLHSRDAIGSTAAAAKAPSTLDVQAESAAAAAAAAGGDSSSYDAVSESARDPFLPPAAKRSRTESRAAVNVGNNSTAASLDLAAAARAATAAEQQVGGGATIATTSSSVLDALRTIAACRAWVPATLCISNADQGQQPEAMCDPSSIRVVSYNILADQYAHGKSKAYCPSALRQWSSRWPRIAGELAAYQPHILCLQEVDDHLWSAHMLPLFRQQLGLEGIYWPRRYGNQKSLDGIALLFDSSRFKLLDQKRINFKDQIPQPVPAGEGAFWKLVGGYAEGAVMALLQCTTTNKALLAVCTHLWYDPKQPHVKLAQAHLLSKCCTDYAAELAQRGCFSSGSSSGSCRHGSSGSCGSPVSAMAGGLQQQQNVAEGSLQEQQRQQYSKELEQQQQQEVQQLPVLVCGDFNSLWKKYVADAFDRQVLPGQPQISGVYELMSTGSIPSTHSHHPAQRGFRSFGSNFNIAIRQPHLHWHRQPLVAPPQMPNSNSSRNKPAGDGTAPRQPLLSSSGLAGGASSSQQHSRSVSAAVGSAAHLTFNCSAEPLCNDHQHSVEAAAAATDVIGSSRGSSAAAAAAAAGDARECSEGWMSSSMTTRAPICLSQPAASAAAPADEVTVADAATTPQQPQGTLAPGAPASEAPASTQHVAPAAAALPHRPTQFTTSGLQLQSAYMAARGVEPAVTNKHPGFSGCLDYIWVSQSGFEVSGVLALPYEQHGAGGVREVAPAAVQFGSIPDGVWPSDHIAVGAVLRLV